MKIHDEEEDQNSWQRGRQKFMAKTQTWQKPTNSVKTHSGNTIQAKKKRKIQIQRRGMRRVEEDNERKRKRMVIWEI